jgi:hypothetical protein
LVRGRSGFEVYTADDHSLGLFSSPRKAAAATPTRPWVGQTTAELRLAGYPESMSEIDACKE